MQRSVWHDYNNVINCFFLRAPIIFIKYCTVGVTEIERRLNIETLLISLISNMPCHSVDPSVSLAFLKTGCINGLYENFTRVFLIVGPFLRYQGQGHVSRSRSNIKVTFKKNTVTGGISVSQTHTFNAWKFEAKSY